MNSNLVDEIRKIENFSDEEIEMLLGFLEKKFIPKGEHFLQMNQISRHIAWIDTGIMMHYNLHDGLEIPCNFSLEGDCMGNLKSFSSATPTEVAIKALEDTWIQELSADQLQQLFAASPRWRVFQNHLVQQVFFVLAQHNADLAMLNAKERYYKFMQEKPQLLNRVPQYYIAAYLGIKPQSLSRLRNEK